MSVDQAFVRAIYTIKSLSRGPNALSKPPEDARIKLYGLYKQATEGDVNGILPRPAGPASPQIEAGQRKWDAWKSQEGLSRTQAKLEYVGFLLETMRGVAGSGQSLNENTAFTELERLYTSAKSQPLPSSPPDAASVTRQYPHNRAPSLSSHYSAYSQFLRRPPGAGTGAATAYSEFGLSDAGERLSDLGATNYLEPSMDDSTQNWKQDVAWQLETINEEINSMRRRYAPYAGTGSGPSSVAPVPASKPHGRRSSGPPAPASESGWIDWFLQWFKLMGVHLLRLIERLLGDATLVVTFLLVVRFIAARPHLLRKFPFSRRVVELLGRIVALILREIGFEVRPLATS